MNPEPQEPPRSTICGTCYGDGSYNPLTQAFPNPTTSPDPLVGFRAFLPSRSPRGPR
jgi:hypothetical protein